MFGYILILISFLSFGVLRQARADIPDTSTFLNSTTASAMVKAIGFSMDHRSYEPATPLSSSGIGLDLGIETTLVQPPSDLGSALSGFGGASGTIPILPSLKFHAHKGFGDRLDIGVSFLPPIPSIPFVGSSMLIGGDAKLVIFNPEEGPTWAFRVSYNVNSLVYDRNGQKVTVKTGTITPQLLISKKLTFADPYLGTALQYATGSVQVTVPVPTTPPEPSIADVILTENGTGLGVLVFGGVSFRVPRAGLKITLEGAYSPIGMNYLGTKIGFAL